MKGHEVGGCGSVEPLKNPDPSLFLKTVHSGIIIVNLPANYKPNSMIPNLFATTTFLIISLFSHAQTDQELVWATYFGGDQWDDLYSTVVIPDDGFIAVGSSSSLYDLTTEDVHQESHSGGGSDGIIVKVDVENDIEWVTYFGGEQHDLITDVKLLSDGSFVIAGYTQSESGISTANAFMEEYPGNRSAFVSRFSDEGEQIWGTYIGGSGQINMPPFSVSIAIDGDDNIILIGTTYYANFPVTSNAHQEVFGGGEDGFVTKFDTEGNMVWSTFLGGESQDFVTSVAVTSNNDIVVAGSTGSQNNISEGEVHQSEKGGSSDVFLTRFSPEGERIWGTYYGGPSAEFSVKDIVLGTDELIYFRLKTHSSSGIATPGAHLEELNVDASVALACFSPEGHRLWGTYFGNEALNVGSGITIVNEQIVLVGIAHYEEGYVMGNPFQSELYSTLPYSDIIIAGFSLEGEQEWGTFYGGEASELPRMVVPYDDYRLLLVGSTPSTTNMTTDNAFQSFHAGLQDGIMAIFDFSNATYLEESEKLQIQISPNPTRGPVRLQLPPSFNFRADVSVYNLTGQIVTQHAGFHSMQYLLLPHPAGMYIVECRNGEDVVRTRVVVK